jgi:hypothetical protein
VSWGRGGVSTGSALESGEWQRTVGRVIRLAGQVGYRELGPVDDLVGRVRDSYESWGRIRQGGRGSGG